MTPFQTQTPSSRINTGCLFKAAVCRLTSRINELETVFSCFSPIYIRTCLKYFSLLQSIVGIICLFWLKYTTIGQKYIWYLFYHLISRTFRPRPVPLLTPLSKLSVCGSSVLAISLDGDLLFWGEQLFIPVSDGRVQYPKVSSFVRPTPLTINVAGTIVDVVACYGGGIVVTADGRMFRYLAITKLE